MAGTNSKNINSGVALAEATEQILLQKMEDNRRWLQVMNTVMQQKTAELQKVQEEISELKKIQTGGKSR